MLHASVATSPLTRAGLRITLLILFCFLRVTTRLDRVERARNAISVGTRDRTCIHSFGRGTALSWTCDRSGALPACCTQPRGSALPAAPAPGSGCGEGPAAAARAGRSGGRGGRITCRTPTSPPFLKVSSVINSNNSCLLGRYLRQCFEHRQYVLG